jgi:hypothetical protein
MGCACFLCNQISATAASDKISAEQLRENIIPRQEIISMTSFRAGRQFKPQLSVAVFVFK